MLTIRRANLADVENIVLHLNKHIQSCKNYYPGAEKEAVALTVHSSYHHTSPMLTLLCLKDDQIIGIASVVASRYLWANKMQAEIRLVYVDPCHRGGRAFHYMMRDIEKWCIEKQCDQISFSIATGNDDENIANMLTHHGWGRDGIGLVKRL